MFDISFFELLMIAIVALLVLGPERLPKAARFAGLWVRRARAQWYSVKSELENELAADELKRSLQQTQASLREVQDDLQRSGESVRRELESVGRDVQSAVPTQADAGHVDPDRAPSVQAASVQAEPVSTPDGGPDTDAAQPPAVAHEPSATHDDHDRR
ncbi:sec-independent protein translocase protein TatB [Lysobacter niastensis]|uniref:Sec-independent protein translocase protein TatB n=1 Tax=Lysobacter niastensis TaxID=380629 RepID=A0ABU1W6K1_9GAMM|nr:sec-independent protein translocase protein TatB [Lysobacter niastensis]